VIAAAVTDVIHLLAELIENATLFSPSTTRVEVRAERVANGFAIEVEDRGLGMEPGQLTVINEQLADPPDFDVADADRLGLFVTGRLAARHAIQVSLAPSAYRGIKAIVLLPETIVITPPDSGAADPAYGGSIRPSLRSSEALSLVGTARARSFATVDTDGVSGAPGAMDGYDETAYPADDDAFDDAGTFHGLPRRVRPGGSSARAAGGGAHAAAAHAGPAPAHVPPEAPAPEHARNLFSSLQSGWLRSRETDDIPASGAGDTGDSGTSAASGPSATWLDDTEHDATPQGGTARHDEEM
jgi:hypothetical protein